MFLKIFLKNFIFVVVIKPKPEGNKGCSLFKTTHEKFIQYFILHESVKELLIVISEINYPYENLNLNLH